MPLITRELLADIVAPLLILSLWARWPMRTAIPCLFVMPMLWYPTYAPIHELSHVLGTYLVGGSVTLLYPVPLMLVRRNGIMYL